MKILPVPLIREADAHTIRHEPIADIDLMERASETCFLRIREIVPLTKKIEIFCGQGNNGGDGFAIARMLKESGYRVDVHATGLPEKMSPSCRINYTRAGECNIITGIGDMPLIDNESIVIDALFGNGLSRQVEGITADLIRHINSGKAAVISIDVPSGMFCDSTTTGISEEAVIRADVTLTFAPPKLAFFFPENDRFIGDWELMDIGLSSEFIDSANVDNYMVVRNDVLPLLKRRNKFAHKGNFGHALLIAGSTGKTGAAVLAARGCARSGAGLVTTRTPGSGITALQTTVPESMLSIDPDPDQFSEVPDLQPYNAIGIGPGLGTSAKTASALKVLIQQTLCPVVFDADAINILAENKTWLAFIPKGSIFTPHPKEFERLAGKCGDQFERNRMQREFSFRNQCFVILKGAHTAITTPDGRCFFNTTGNPGMATGGSGDVLTGLLTGLLAQHHTPLETALLGVYLHGMAGDLALQETGFEALIAGDIINYLGKSFQTLYGKL